MNRQTTIFLIIAGAVILIILLIVKNLRDKKKLITPDEGTDPVEDENMERENQRDIS